MNLSNKIALELYRIDTQNNRYVKVDEVSTFKNLRWFDRLNGIGGGNFDLDIKDPAANISNWIPFVTQVGININGTIVWVGCVEKPDGSYQGVSGKAGIRLMSYLYHLERRFITLKYNDEDAAAKAWDMINEVQSRGNGELMIRQGEIQTVGNTSDTLQNQEVSQAIMNQSDNLVGYSFEFVPVTVDGKLDHMNFNVYQRENYGVIRDTYAPLEFGFNVQSATYSLDGEVFNNITGEGAGTAAGVLSVQKSNAASQVKYTRRETIAPFKNILTYSTLNTVTQSRLDKVSGEVYSISINLKKGSEYQFGSFKVGDFLKLNLEFPNGMIFDDLARVIEIGYSVDSNGVITVEPKLEIIL